MSQYRNGVLLVTNTGSNTASAGTSASAALPVGSDGNVARMVRVTATAAAHFRTAVGAPTAVTTDLLIQPGDAVVLQIPYPHTHYAVIQSTGAGVVQVSPVEQA